MALRPRHGRHDCPTAGDTTEVRPRNGLFTERRAWATVIDRQGVELLKERQRRLWLRFGLTKGTTRRYVGECLSCAVLKHFTLTRSMASARKGAFGIGGGKRFGISSGGKLEVGAVFGLIGVRSSFPSALTKLRSRALSMATFKMPEMDINATGWGPTASVKPEKFNNIPYAPFSKTDRLGRAADWVNASRPGRPRLPLMQGSSQRALASSEDNFALTGSPLAFPNRPQPVPVQRPRRRWLRQLRVHLR